MRFSKYSGAGNDFILIDGRSETFDPSLVPSLCHRQQGIGADGIILLDSFNNHIFKMSIFNADGSVAEMCGNGIRCFTLFLRELGFFQDFYSIQNIEGNIYTTSFFSQNQIKVNMPSVSNIEWQKKCQIQSQEMTLHVLNTGVPHAVVMVPDLDSVDVQKAGKTIRTHPFFAPKGTNVNFAKVDSQGTVHVRTFERGVEDETLACGTGACATGLVAAKLYQLKPPISVKVKSQDILSIDFRQENESFFDLSLTGPAKKVFEGFLIN